MRAKFKTGKIVAPLASPLSLPASPVTPIATVATVAGKTPPRGSSGLLNSASPKVIPNSSTRSRRLSRASEHSGNHYFYYIIIYIHSPFFSEDSVQRVAVVVIFPEILISTPSFKMENFPISQSDKALFSHCPGSAVLYFLCFHLTRTLSLSKLYLPLFERIFIQYRYRNLSVIVKILDVVEEQSKKLLLSKCLPNYNIAQEEPLRTCH
jgi:hypothetical protein